MRPIKFDLPLNGTRIATLEQLEKNLTPEILEPFRAGKLAKWLQARSLNGQAEAVEALLAGDNKHEVQLLKGLYEVFGGETDHDLLQVAIAERKRSLPLSQESYDMELEAVKTAFEKEIELIKSKYEIEQTKNSIKNNIDIEKISEIIGTTLFTLNDMGNISISTDYKDINLIIQNLYDEINAVLEELGLIKMSIFNNQIRHLVDVIRKSKHASSKLSKFEESIISVNCTDIFNANTVIILLKTYRDKSKLLILVLRIMAEYFDVIKVNDNSNDDNFGQMLCIGKGLKELLNITIIDTNKNYATNENIKVNISGYLEI